VKRELTCIVCPLGCSLQVELSEAGEILNITGNTCPRGAVYARTECTDPRRTITTTLRCEDGSMVAVKTDRPIPKDKMHEAMKQIGHVVVKLPVQIGDVVAEDVFGSNVVACQNRDFTLRD